jgi:hypothetical protein
MRWLFLVLVVFSGSLNAEILSTDIEAKDLATSVMQKAGQDKMKEGLELLRPFVIFPMSEFDVQLSNIDMQLPVIGQRFGKSIGFELVSEEKVGDSLIQYMYLQKFEKHEMVWRFIFYKSQERWLLNTFNFNDQVKPLFP